MFLPNLTAEKNLWLKGFKSVVGIDEVGRGSWAGPLVAAGVILPQNFTVPKGFADSKQLTKTARGNFDIFIRKVAIGFKIVEIPTSKINQTGIGQSTQSIFRKIVRTISPSPDFALIDAFNIKYLPKFKQSAIKHGDQLSASIAAASIIAKVYRDKLMEKESTKYPVYGFERHKGYGTKFHQEAIQKHGFCQIHRTNYNLDYLF